MRRRWSVLEESYKGTGVMVALWPKPDVVESLRAFGVALGLPVVDAEDVHLTLAYLGEIDELDAAALKRLHRRLAGLAQMSPVLTGVLGGVGRFTASPSSGGKDVLWASADLPALPGFLPELYEVLSSVGLPASRVHGFTPHLTLAYIDTDATFPLPPFPTIPVVFGALTLAVGEKRTAFPLATEAP